MYKEILLRVVICNKKEKEKEKVSRCSAFTKWAYKLVLC